MTSAGPRPESPSGLGHFTSAGWHAILQTTDIIVIVWGAPDTAAQDQGTDR